MHRFSLLAVSALAAFVPLAYTQIPDAVPAAVSTAASQKALSGAAPLSILIFMQASGTPANLRNNLFLLSAAARSYGSTRCR